MVKADQASAGSSSASPSGFRGGAFLEYFFGRDFGFFLFGALGQNILAARLALGFVLAAGDIDGDVHPHFGMQHHRNGEEADGLDRLADLNLIAVDLEAARLDHGRRHRGARPSRKAGRGRRPGGSA